MPPKAKVKAKAKAGAKAKAKAKAKARARGVPGLRGPGGAGRQRLRRPAHSTPAPSVPPPVDAGGAPGPENAASGDFKPIAEAGIVRDREYYIRGHISRKSSGDCGEDRFYY